MSNLQLVPATTTGSREAPWMGCGVEGHWTDYKDALTAAGMDFYAVGQNAYTHIYDAIGYTDKLVPGVQVNVRPDTNDILGVVGGNYGIVQNEDAFSMLEPFTQAGGVITNAGYTEQGLHFMVLRLRDTKILGDTYDVDIMATNSFNGAFPCAIIMVPTRIICQNMYRKLMGSADNVMRFRHCSQIDERMNMMRQAAGSVLSYMDAFKLQLEKSYNNKLDKYDIKKLIGLLFPYPKPGGTREVMTRERVDMYRKEFYDKYYLADDNANFLGTGMGFLNAYYDYLSHREPTKNMKGEWVDRRLSGLVSGNDIKTKVIQEVL